MKGRDIQWKHRTFLYPVVRVFSSKSAGSGTIIYSEPDPRSEGEYLTFVLTNHHVIEDCIKVKKDWDSLLKMEIEKEFLEKAKVEVFEYVNLSWVDSANRYSATIECYDKNHDLAILKIESPRKFEYVAKVIPRGEIKKLHLFRPVVSCGCSLAHEPFCMMGEITFLSEVIDQKKYVMTSASSIFGNSGGALYDYETGYLIGVTSRVTAIQLGFGVDVLTWMSFSCHPERLYEFFDEQEFMFLYDKSTDYWTAIETRKQKELEAKLKILSK